MNLLILGGNRYNVPGILSAKENGFYTLVVDMNKNAEGFKYADRAIPVDISQKEQLLKYIQQNKIKVDGIVSMAEVGVVPAAYISGKLSVKTHTLEIAKVATSKYLMRQKWLAIPQYNIKYTVVGNEKELFKGIEEIGTFPLIFKPEISLGGSRGVIKVNTLDEVQKAYEFALKGSFSGQNVIIEEFVIGREFSAEVLIYDNKTSVLCIGEKVKTPFPYRVDVSVNYPANLNNNELEEVKDMLDKAVKAVGLKWGVAHIEFCLTPNGFKLFELGARCGGGHTPQIAYHVSGVNEFIEYCRMACGLQPDNFYTKYQKGAIYRFIIAKPGKVKEIIIPSFIENNQNILDFDVDIRPGDIISDTKTTSDRRGFVVTKSDDLVTAQEIANEACRSIIITYVDGKQCAPIF